MADTPGDLFPFSSSYLLNSLPHLHERVIFDPSKPSGIRVLGKSMFVLAAGWMVAVVWLWLRGLYAADMTVMSVGPALALIAVGWMFRRFTRPASYTELRWREWRHACWWTVVPNALVIATAWMMTTRADG